MPCRLGGPEPSGRESAAAGVLDMRPRNRSRSLRRASTIRASLSSAMAPLYAAVRIAVLRPSRYPCAVPFRDECGVFGVFGHSEAANLAYLGIHALQHRGQESAGIAALDGGKIQVHKAMGLVADIFGVETLARLPGDVAIGHTRYSTAGQSRIENAQPFVSS